MGWRCRRQGCDPAHRADFSGQSSGRRRWANTSTRRPPASSFYGMSGRLRRSARRRGRASRAKPPRASTARGSFESSPARAAAKSQNREAAEERSIRGCCRRPTGGSEASEGDQAIPRSKGSAPEREEEARREEAAAAAATPSTGGGRSYVTRAGSPCQPGFECAEHAPHVAAAETQRRDCGYVSMIRRSSTSARPGSPSGPS